jgi:hypothetical protein
MGLSVVKSVAAAVLAAVLMVASAPAPARAQDIFAGFVVARVCLPYASRAKTFEAAIRAARDMEFRRPVGNSAPLDEWVTAVELVSKDGRWRLRIEEGTVTEGDRDVYSVTCGVSSAQASARELGEVARLVVRGNPMWSQDAGAPWRWDRRTPHPDEYAIRIDVTEAPGQRAVLAARGSYY